MTNFAIKKIEGIRNNNCFYKLIIDEKCDFDEFWSEIQKDGNLRKELLIIQTRIQNLVDGYKLPTTKYRELTSHKSDTVKDFELKTDHLRVYFFIDDRNKIIVLGGKKTNQKSDIKRLRSIKKAYINR